MTALTDRIPKGHGELFFDPPLAQWKEDALRNRERLVKESFWGQSALKVRAAMNLPTEYPLIFSGHQPVFFHPGLWVKCLAASTLAEAVQGTAIHKITDTALAPEHLHYLPEVEDNGKSRKKILEFFTNKDLKKQERITPYCFLPPPDYSALEKIFSDAQVYCPDPVKNNIRQYEEKIFKGIHKNATWNSFHLSVMSILDQICGTQRLYLEASKVWAFEPFYFFVAQWLKNLPELNDCYNQSLEEYRKKHGITHDLEPMPNLKFEDWWFEIPFWGATKYHQRHSLWAKNDGKHIVLKIKGGEGSYSLSLDDPQKELSALNISIWPKAIPQTLFCRMYLCDFFIHGTGGAVYEEVGDMIFSRYFRLKPLSFGVATGTYLVDPKESHGVDVVLTYEEKIAAWERALEKNPEYLFTKPEDWKRDLPSFMHPIFLETANNPGLRKLATEKERLISLLKDPAQRSQASKKIKEVNFALYDGYTDVLKALEKGLLDVGKVKDTKDVLSFREYPFFCYPPETFTDMKEKIRLAAHSA